MSSTDEYRKADFNADGMLSQSEVERYLASQGRKGKGFYIVVGAFLLVAVLVAALVALTR